MRRHSNLPGAFAKLSTLQLYRWTHNAIPDMGLSADTAARDRGGSQMIREDRGTCG